MQPTFSGLFKAHAPLTTYELATGGLRGSGLSELHANTAARFRNVDARVANALTPHADQFTSGDPSARFELPGVRSHLLVQVAKEDVMEAEAPIVRSFTGNYKGNVNWEFTLKSEQYLITGPDARAFWEQTQGLGAEIDAVEAERAKIAEPLAALAERLKELDASRPTGFWSKIFKGGAIRKNDAAVAAVKTELQELRAPLDALQKPLLEKQADARSRNAEKFNAQVLAFFAANQKAEIETGKEATVIKI